MIYSSAKAWWFYWLLMLSMYGGAIYMLHFLVYKSGFFKKGELIKFWKQAPGVFFLGCILLIFITGCFLTVRNYANYLYGIELTKSGIYWRDWDRGHLMKWKQVSDIEVYTNIKGRPAAIITSKNGERLKADSLAFAHWDNFVNDLSRYSGCASHETDRKFA